MRALLRNPFSVTGEMRFGGLFARTQSSGCQGRIYHQLMDSMPGKRRNRKLTHYRFRKESRRAFANGRIPPSHVLLNVRLTGFSQRQVLFVLRPANHSGHRNHAGQRSDELGGRDYRTPAKTAPENAVISCASHSAFIVRCEPAH